MQVMHGGFFGRAVRLMFWGSVFRGSDKIIRLCEDMNLGGIFQKFALILLKIWKTTEKMSEKCKDSLKFSVFAHGWKIGIIIYELSWSSH